MTTALGFNGFPSFAGGTNRTKAPKTDARLEYHQKVSNPTSAYNHKITGKIQDILQGEMSISFKNLLMRNSDIATIYNRLSDEGKKLVEFVISLDGEKDDVTERELRNLYRLMDMNGGNVDSSFYDGNITVGSGRVMIEDLARDTTGIAKENLRSAHHQTKTTKELAQ